MGAPANDGPKRNSVVHVMTSMYHHRSTSGRLYPFFNTPAMHRPLPEKLCPIRYLDNQRGMEATEMHHSSKYLTACHLLLMQAISWHFMAVLAMAWHQHLNQSQTKPGNSW